MAHDTDRPSPRSRPIDPKEKTEILHELLGIERARLAEACRIETERRIVFPETTVIIKDIKSILAALSAKTENAEETEDIVKPMTETKRRTTSWG